MITAWKDHERKWAAEIKWCNFANNEKVISRRLVCGMTDINEKLLFNKVFLCRSNQSEIPFLAQVQGLRFFRHTFPCWIMPSQPGAFDPHRQRANLNSDVRKYLIRTQRLLDRRWHSDHIEARGGTKDYQFMTLCDNSHFTRHRVLLRRDAKYWELDLKYNHHFNGMSSEFTGVVNHSISSTKWTDRLKVILSSCSHPLSLSCVYFK